ncbi:hypothetical protein NRIC_17980 [Enterococcus florum]|uniref:Uncharacterized protein n=1 Tax=Enterococcus florum TaxID=2480627 RepID=A0A4P5P7G9_9ENTE|nr:hypothetical protein [Enterococcus florum]GCF93907.1 hypothetical protein NRIC_17980 [Enterococcus florum]
MEQSEILEMLEAKDTKAAQASFVQLEKLCQESKAYYEYWDVFIQAVSSKRSCARGRGFKLAMVNLQWDHEDRGLRDSESLLAVLEDEKAPVVRQCLPYVTYVFRYKPDLSPMFLEKIGNLTLDKYKESMQRLIQQDVERLMQAREKPHADSN